MASNIANAEAPKDPLRLATEDNLKEKVQSRESLSHGQTPSEGTEKSEEDGGKGGLGAYFVSESVISLPAMD